MTAPTHLRSHARRGAALIIALVILAGLLMLGLPFLFTQSSSLAGTRTFAQNQQALLGQDSAENLGIALAASAMAFHLQSGAVPQDDWSSLYWGLRGQTAMQPHLGPLTQVAGATLLAQNLNHVGIDLRTLADSLPIMPAAGTPGYGAASLVGVALEDESGKLDPNCLDVLDWATLLGAVGIADWPADPTLPAVPANNALAQALAQLRFPPVNGQQGVGRITYLEQLMSANPTALFGAGARGALTRAELEQLRPHLTLANRAAGRAGPRIPDPGFQLSGTAYSTSTGTAWSSPPAAYNLTLIDLGTLIGPAGGGAVTLDSLPPQRMAGNPVTPNLIGDGTTLVVEDESTANGAQALQIEHIIPANQAIFFGGLQSGWPVAIAATPTLNLHQADSVVLTVMDGLKPPLPAVAPAESPIPDSLAGAAGLTRPNFTAGGDFPTGGLKPAFSLLDPLSNILLLGKTAVLPSIPGDPGVPQGTASINGYAAAMDAGGQLRPMLMNGAAIIRIQSTNLALLPSSGWAQLSGARADATQTPVQEFIYYSAISLNSPVAGQATLNVSRGQTWLNSGPPASSFFTDSIPPSLPAGVAPIAPPLTITFFGPHELPPLAITSRGLVTVEASSTVVDPAGHQVAQRGRRVVAQAVPQEYTLEERWQKQSQLHALVASRQGSLLTTFPRPYPRLSDVFPVDADPPLAASGVLDQDIGLRPTTLRTLLNGWMAIDWGVPLNGTQGTFLNDRVYNGLGQSSLGNPPQPPAGASLPAVAALTPEGLLCGESGPGGAVYLVYPVGASDPGPLRLTDSPTRPGNPATPNSEISPRQLGLWVKPSGAWSGNAPITLLEMRMPMVNAGLPLAATTTTSSATSSPVIDQRSQPVGAPVPGSAVPPSPVDDQQNFWSLYYDASSSGHEQLVLCFANGAIEHPYTYGPLLPSYDPTVPGFDNRSLGSAASVAAATLPLAPGRPMNRVECRYRYTLDPGVWHLIQVAWTRDAPGAQAIIVDGLVGRDISRSAPLMVMQDPGDHLTLPCLVLNQDLLAIPYEAAAPGLSDVIPSIAVLAWSSAGHGVADILPPSGYVRIGNEYLSYDGITASSLTYCRRGQRQNTRLNLVNANPITPPSPPPAPPAMANANVWWPTVPVHHPGELIVPGGYRLVSPGTQQPTSSITVPPGTTPPNNVLLRGGGTLVALDGTIDATKPGLWPGDQSNYGNSALYNDSLLWGTIAASQAGDSRSGTSPLSDPGPPVTPPTLPPTPIPILVNDPTLIHLTASYGTDASGFWPLRGYAKVVASQAWMLTPPAGVAVVRIFYYDNTGHPAPSAGGEPFHVASTTVYANSAPAATSLTAGSWPAPASTVLSTLLDVSPTSQPVVVMLSLELAMPAAATGDPSNDPTIATSLRYDAGSAVGPSLGQPPRARQVQIYDQGDTATHTNAVEWLSYHWLASTPTGVVPPSPAAGFTSCFLVNFAGFPWYGFAQPSNQRGMERTRGPVDPASPAILATVLPALPGGSRVLPVQSVNISNAGYNNSPGSINPSTNSHFNTIGIIRTGDVLTIAPNALYSSAAAGTPNAYTYDAAGHATGPGTWQAVVRYAPMDGFGVKADLSDWIAGGDTDNELFAFTEELPAAFTMTACDLLCWPGWNGTDLSPPAYDPAVAPALLAGVPGLMPWSNAFATNFLQTAEDRQLYAGAQDDRTVKPVTVMEGTIDALYAAGQPALGGGNTEVLGTIGTGEVPIGVDGNPPSAVTWIAGTALSDIAGITVQPSFGPATPTNYGLVQIGGEVFAYRVHVSQLNMQPTSNIDLIGRGLLGSSPRQHSGREPMVYLPLGPVAPVNGTLTKDSVGPLPLPPGLANLDAPALLVTSPDGARYEFIAAPNGATAPWLRGLYNTCTPELARPAQPAWAADATTGLAPLLIGWWPRYASAMPPENAPQWSGLQPAQQSAMLRCRSYAWAGFPLRFYDASFLPTDNLGAVTVLDDAGGSFVLMARALSSGFDWNRADAAAAEVALPLGSTTITGAFLTDQFAPLPAGGSSRAAVPVDGAELRVMWRYSANPPLPPASLTATPMTSTKWFALTTIQANSAPTLGSAVLRCRAPSKVIAVESAR